jgi:hypothetical protein
MRRSVSIDAHRRPVNKAAALAIAPDNAERLPRKVGSGEWISCPPLDDGPLEPWVAVALGKWVDNAVVVGQSRTPAGKVRAILRCKCGTFFPRRPGRLRSGFCACERCAISRPYTVRKVAP